MKPILEFNEVNKSYRIIKNRNTTLKERIISLLKKRPKEEVIVKHILKQFNLKIYSGETIGIIGENGAGKSTTLKLIANIIQPDNGIIKVDGAVASLLEIGAGFQSDMTGRENVYLYGTILGLSKKYIAEKYNDIVDFAELKDFMDTPVKNYSSGMYMRLAFSVAIHVDPDIILIDEVLAVGDENFQKKCMNKLEYFQEMGKTIVFVSHDMTSIRKLCDRVVYLYDNGKYKVGPVEQMVNLYFSNIYREKLSYQGQLKVESIKENKVETLSSITESILNADINDRGRWGNNRITIEEVYLSNSSGVVQNVFENGESFTIHIKMKANELVDKAVMGIAIYDAMKNHLSGPNSKDNGIVYEQISGEFYCKVVIKNPPLLEGDYYLTVAVYDYSCREAFDHLEKFFKFRINNNKPMLGTIYLNCEWM